jgi:hypothetical protein
MPAKSETPISSFFKGITIKDIVFIVGIFASSIGWIRSETIKNNEKDNKIEILTTAVNEQTRQLEKINNILTDQQLLNGKIIQYMQMK